MHDERDGWRADWGQVGLGLWLLWWMVWALRTGCRWVVGCARGEVDG